MASITVSHANTSLSSPSLPILLRTFQPGDGAAFAALLADPANGENPNPSGSVMDAAWGEAAVGRMVNSAQQNPSVCGPDGAVLSGPPRLNLAVVLLPGPSAGAVVEKETIIGISGYGAIKTFERDGKLVRAGDVGVLLTDSARGKGYASEALRLSLDWAAAPVAEGGLQLDLLSTTTLADNTRMLAVAEKLGFGGKGVLRPAEHDAEKEEMYYEMTAEEWRSRSRP